MTKQFDKVSVHDAILDHYVETDEAATVADIAKRLGCSPSTVNKIVADPLFETGVSSARRYSVVTQTTASVPVYERNYNTVRCYRQATAWLPSRRWLRDLWVEATARNKALKASLTGMPGTP